MSFINVSAKRVAKIYWSSLLKAVLRKIYPIGNVPVKFCKAENIRAWNFRNMQVLLCVDCMKQKRAALPIFCKKSPIRAVQKPQTYNFQIFAHKWRCFCICSISSIVQLAYFCIKKAVRESMRLWEQAKTPPSSCFFMKLVRLDVADHVRTVIAPISDKNCCTFDKKQPKCGCTRKTVADFFA